MRSIVKIDSFEIYLYTRLETQVTLLQINVNSSACEIEKPRLYIANFILLPICDLSTILMSSTGNNGYACEKPQICFALQARFSSLRQWYHRDIIRPKKGRYIWSHLQDTSSCRSVFTCILTMRTMRIQLGFVSQMKNCTCKLLICRKRKENSSRCENVRVHPRLALQFRASVKLEQK